MRAEGGNADVVRESQEDPHFGAIERYGDRVSRHRARSNAVLGTFPQFVVSVSGYADARRAQWREKDGEIRPLQEHLRRNDLLGKSIDDAVEIEDVRGCQKWQQLT